MNQDYIILRELGKQIAEIAALPVQQEKKALWTANNDLHPVRPMVYIDQLPWHELNLSEEMRLQCTDPFLRSIEHDLKSLLYRWKHFPCDMVVENRVDIPMSVEGLDYGVHIVEEIRRTDVENDIVSHKYKDQLSNEESLAALREDQIRVNREEDARRLEICQEIFHGILPVRLSGVQIHAGLWDRIAQMRPAESILWDFADRPEFIEETVLKFVDLTNAAIDQCEELGLLDEKLQYVHCTGAYTDQLPKDGMEDGKAKARNVWAFGMAQLLSTVSPAMHEEFEIDLVRPLYERFGLLYYGCCEPLQDKIEIIRKIRNVRKISVSPWADIEKSADNIAGDYVFSCKSNPAFICAGGFDEENIRDQLSRAKAACSRTGTPLEIILKDVSSVCSHLDYVDRWEKIAMEYALG